MITPSVQSLVDGVCRTKARPTILANDTRPAKLTQKETFYGRSMFKFASISRLLSMSDSGFEDQADIPNHLSRLAGTSVFPEEKHTESLDAILQWRVRPI